jgi:hypothetical protein
MHDMKSDRGRITFPGNPWPSGHAIRQLRWTARLEPETGVWFDLHLVSANYYAGDPIDERSPEEDDSWRSKVVWGNYHRCTLSSTFWSDRGRGFLAGTRKRPLDLAALPDRTFRVDTKPPAPPPAHLSEGAAFHIYLLGHDAVRGHRIRFPERVSKDTFSLEWKAKIALAYGGSTVFRHELVALAPRVRFGGITLPKGTRKRHARELLAPFVADAKRFTIERGVARL